MKKALVVAAAFLLGGMLSVKAGNPDRAGEAGASELLVNPWARSAGFFGMNSARVEGVESMQFNVAGLARIKRMEAVFSRLHWMQGSEIFFNAVGVGQKFGKNKKDAIALNFVALDMGEIEVTTSAQPEGGLGTYKPQFFNIGLAYSRAFSNSIYGGLTIRLISERISDLSAFGFSVDFGLMYITGKLDNARFGIALRNIGTPMRFSGDGLSFRGEVQEGDYQATVSQRTEKFELPSQLNIGAAYDIYVDNIKNDPAIEAHHRITIAANFTSNSFGKDFVGGGLEYSFRDYLMLRAGYRWEDGITKLETRTTVHTGFSAGLTVQVPIKKNGPSFALDYAYLTTQPFKGTHVYGIRFNM